MISCSRFILLPALVAALALLGRLSESASPPNNPLTLSSHHHRHRPSAAEQTFVRGMMAADHQFGLYMTLSETSRGGGSANTSDEDNDGRCTKNNHPTIRACEDAIINARKAAFRFGNGLRREAIRHMRLDDKHSG